MEVQSALNLYNRSNREVKFT